MFSEITGKNKALRILLIIWLVVLFSSSTILLISNIYGGGKEDEIILESAFKGNLKPVYTYPEKLKIESIDMLRVLEHGCKVKMVLADFRTYSVDTPEDLRFVEGLMQNDPLAAKYSVPGNSLR